MTTRHPPTCFVSKTDRIQTLTNFFSNSSVRCHVTYCVQHSRSCIGLSHPHIQVHDHVCRSCRDVWISTESQPAHVCNLPIYSPMQYNQGARIASNVLRLWALQSPLQVEFYIVTNYDPSHMFYTVCWRAKQSCYLTKIANTVICIPSILKEANKCFIVFWKTSREAVWQKEKEPANEILELTPINKNIRL
jgi:hypothetical protein